MISSINAAADGTNVTGSVPQPDNQQ